MSRLDEGGSQSSHSECIVISRPMDVADCGFSQHGDLGVGGLTFFSVVYFNGLSLLGNVALKSPVIFTLKKKKKHV